MSRFAILDDDEELEQPITLLLRQTSALLKQGIIDETHKSALKDGILSGDEEQIQSARTFLDELSISKTQKEPQPKSPQETQPKETQPEQPKERPTQPKDTQRNVEENKIVESTLSTKAKPFVPIQTTQSTQPTESKKIVLILRGLPGSGKSSLVKTVVERFALTSSPWVCSADHYFTDKSGHYNFDLKLLSKAHNACMSKYLDGMLSGERFIVVDNTSSTRWEYENYLKVAKIGGYEIQVREIRCPDEKSARVFAGRNTHNVPVAAVLAMWKRWESDADAILEDAWMGHLSQESKDDATANDNDDKPERPDRPSVARRKERKAQEIAPSQTTTTTPTDNQ